MSADSLADALARADRAQALVRSKTFTVAWAISDELPALRELADVVRAELYPAIRRASLAAALAMADETRAELLRANSYGGGDESVTSERDAYTGALEALADVVRAELDPHARGAQCDRETLDRIAEILRDGFPEADPEDLDGNSVMHAITDLVGISGRRTVTGPEDQAPALGRQRVVSRSGLHGTLEHVGYSPVAGIWTAEVLWDSNARLSSVPIDQIEPEYTEPEPETAAGLDRQQWVRRRAAGFRHDFIDNPEARARARQLNNEANTGQEGT
jgi:hypothetical protein